jgi:hypothetical protein
MRLARREIRRHPGRSLSLMVLVAVTVLRVKVVSVFVYTNNESAGDGTAPHSAPNVLTTTVRLSGS